MNRRSRWLSLAGVASVMMLILVNLLAGNYVAAQVQRGEHAAVIALTVGAVVALGLGLTLMVFNDRLRVLVARRTKDLRESESRLREAQQMAHLGHWLLDVKTGDVEWSEEVYRIFQLDPEEFTPHIDLIMALSPWPEDHQRDKELIQRAVESREQGSYEQRFLRPDGSTGYYFSTFQGVYDDDGRLVAMRGTVQDITERKRAEEALKESSDRLRLALQAVSMGTWEWDLVGNRVIWSPETLDIFGVAADEFGGTYEAYLGFAAPEIREEVDREVQEFLSGNRESTVIQYEHEIVRGDGKAGWIEVRGTLFPDKQGRPVRMTGICTDITARKCAEQEREDLIAELEAKNAELERFTYTVSHDLKSPLITIQGYVGMLRQDLADGDSGPVEDDLARISNAADKMAQLLDELLELSRIGRVVHPPEDVPLEELAREALELVGGQVQANKVQVEIPPDLPVLFGDRDRLREVLQNLIDNAAKYMGDQPRPRVEIGSRRDGNQTTCYVRDNGIGIEPRYHQKVFGLFDQLDQKAAGSGIGLALVKRIVEVHGGRIWVESEGAGHGSTFCFTVAARSASTQDRHTESHMPAH
ncbi:MAG: PAS domain S-box protein [Pirellulales bacterium]|nr:PAS domain S-box protein [Pirellulales bacterium]